MVVVKIAKSGRSGDVIGAADEMNGLDQGHKQGQGWSKTVTARPLKGL